MKRTNALLLGMAVAGLTAGPATAGLVDTVTDTTPGGATIDGTVNAGEYVGTVSGGGGGFGGPIGGATLSLDSDSNGIYFALSGLGDISGNSIRVYFDTTAGGFTDISTTAGFNDDGDFGREVISTPAQNGVVLPFAADYGWVISPAFGGFQALFQLATGGANSLIADGTGVTATTVGENPSNPTFEAFIPYANLDISAGDTVNFVMLYGNNNNFDTDGAGGDEGTYLSDEGFPFQFTSGNPGLGPVTVSDYDQLVTAVPEPATLALIGAGGMLMLSRRRRREA